MSRIVARSSSCMARRFVARSSSCMARFASLFEMPPRRGAWLVLIALIGGCDPIWSLEVNVRAPDRRPVENAALILTGCPQQNDQNVGDVVGLTDANGVTSVGGLGSEYPACSITVAKPGYATQQTSFDLLCHGNLEDCERVQTYAVMLQPTLP